MPCLRRLYERLSPLHFRLDAYHIPVILLSATLLGKRRAELLRACLGSRRAAGTETETGQTYPSHRSVFLQGLCNELRREKRHHIGVGALQHPRFAQDMAIVQTVR